MVQAIIKFIVQVVNTVPVLKGYRTFILVGIKFVLAGLDQFGVGGGNLHDTIEPVLDPVILGTALANTAGIVASAKEMINKK